MFPNVSIAFNNWTSAVQMKIIQSVADDFEVDDQTLSIVAYEAVMQPMPPQQVNRKPEGMRIWKWWESWSVTKLQPNTIVQDMDGVQFKVQSVQDWNQGGYYHYEMTEIPIGS